MNRRDFFTRLAQAAIIAMTLLKLRAAAPALYPISANPTS